MDHNEAADRAVELRLIGCILCGSGAGHPLARCVRDGLTADDISERDLRMVFSDMLDYYASDRPFTSAQAEEVLVKFGHPAKMAYHIIKSAVADSDGDDIEQVLDMVRLASARRKAVAAAHLIITDATNQQITEPSEICSRAFNHIMATGRIGHKTTTLEEYANNLLSEFRKIRSKQLGDILRSPFSQYGKLIGEYKNGVHIVAARQKVGKSSWCFSEVRAMAGLGVPVGTINLELQNELILDRWAAADSGVSTWALRNLDDVVTAEDFDRLCVAVEEVKKLPIIMAPPRLSLQQSFSWIKWAIAEHGIKYVVLDRADKLKADRRYGSAFEKASDYSNRITEFANDTIPMRVVVHLSRRIEQDNSKARSEEEERMPTSADLRNSGDWEQDAYSITLLHRRGGRAAKSEMIHDIACIVEDNRNGPTGVIDFRFDRALHRWEELRPHELPSD